MPPAPPDINSVVTNLELYVLFTDCGHDSAITSMEHCTVVLENILNHVDDMAGGQRNAVMIKRP